MKKILRSLLVSVILTGAILSSQFISVAAGDLSKESIMEEYNQIMTQKDTYIEALGMTFGEASVELSKLSEQYYNAESDEEQDAIFTQMDIIYKALNTVVEYAGSDYEQIAFERKHEAEANEKKEQNNAFEKVLQEFMGYSQKSGIALMGVEEHIIHPDGTETVVVCTISDKDNKEIIRLLDDIIDNDYIKIASKENRHKLSYDVHFMEANLTFMNENGVYDEVLAKIQEVQEILDSDKSDTKAEETTSNTNNSNVIFFTDVHESDWFYSQVMAMTKKGLFVGKGNNLFCPNDTMTRAEFITVVVRSLYPNADLTPKKDQAWWQPIYEVAREKGLIAESEFSINSLEQTISRQEMALISVRALNVLGETDIKSYTYFPDISTVDTYYRDYVCKSYGAGIIVGDDNGNFNPQDTLTRAEATTVLYRIENKSARVKPELKPTGSGTVVDVNAPITITEGAERTNRLAKEGDTVIKADGTSVVLKKGPNGVLGEGQGVAPDLGFYYNVAGANPSRVVDGKMFTGGMLESWDNSIGSNVAGDFYYVHPLTGEGHWGKEWSLIYRASYDKMLEAGIEGKYDGEISPDKQLVWDAEGEEWMPVYNGRNLK